jgi:chromate transporter
VSRLREVAVLFLRLSLTAFGGPAAHIALIEEECVRRRGWMTREQFLDILGVANLIPGPTSTELAMHAGLRRAGWPGLVVGGICFIAPAALIVAALASVYMRVGELPALGGILHATKPVVVVVVLQALVGLGRTALSSPRLLVLAGLTAVGVALGLNEIGTLLGAGVLNVLLTRRVPPFSTSTAGTRLMAMAVLPPDLFLYFLKAGSVIFGSGYVLLAILRTDLVNRLHWLTEGQLLDAIAVGQVTPGPVFTTATFIGYLLGGRTGAVVATLGIFLPAFVFTAVSARLLPRVRASIAARAFLDGVNVAAVVLIAVVALALARAAVTDIPTAAIEVTAALLIGVLGWNSSWVLAGAAAAGFLVFR